VNYYYDTEFAENGKTIDLISIGMVCEDGRVFYMESSEFDESKCNDWVKKNVLPKLQDKKNRKTKEEIRQALLDFIGKDTAPRFIAYVGSYDHIVLCQLFGDMKELPDFFPHYTWDLKQKLEELGSPTLPKQKNKGDHNALEDAKWCKEACDYLKERYGVEIPMNSKKKSSEALVSVKYQMFLLDPNAEKQNMLTAIDPPFSSPSVIDAILKTVKFEGKESVTVIGLEEQIESLLKKVERLDVTDWLDYTLEKRKDALKKLCNELNLECRESLRDTPDEQVLGDELEQPSEITAAPKRWAPPVDLPSSNLDVWEAVKNQPDFKEGWALIKRAGKDRDPVVAMAVYRNFYEAYATKMNRVAWNTITKTDISDQRVKLKGFIEQGEEKATNLIIDLEKHLLHAGLIHKAKSQQFHGIDRHPDTNRLVLTHQIPWVMKPGTHSWHQVISFIKREFGKKFAFQEGKNKIFTQISNTGTVPTEVELVRENEDSINVYVHHQLTEHQAALLTQEKEDFKMRKCLMRMAKQWYNNGKFPKLDCEDFNQ